MLITNLPSDLFFFQESYRLNYPNFTSKYYWLGRIVSITAFLSIKCFYGTIVSLLRNTSLFLHRWFERNIYFVIDMFYESGNILSYADFMHVYNFPIPFKKFQQVVKAIPNGMIQLINNHLSFGSNERIFPELKVYGIEIFYSSCNNKLIRQILQSTWKQYHIYFLNVIMQRIYGKKCLGVTVHTGVQERGDEDCDKQGI